MSHQSAKYKLRHMVIGMIVIRSCSIPAVWQNGLQETKPTEGSKIGRQKTIFDVNC